MNPDLSDNSLSLLGKASCPLETCLMVLEGNYSTTLKKEAMSSIGRKKNSNYKSILIEYCKHDNPEVSMQAIRGLLAFKSDNNVEKFLLTLKLHPNDMIRDIIQSEFSEQGSSTDGQHSSSPDHLKNVVIEGDTLEILDYLPEESIHLTFTSPPYYNARDYSIYSSYTDYLDFLEATFRKLINVTKEGRFFVLNTSPIIIPRAGRKYSSRRYPVPFDIHARLMNIGWEFIDDIVWAKPEKSAKNRISNFNTHRKPLTYKPNARSEYLMVYRKKTDKLIDWNLKQYDEESLQKSLVDDLFERSNIWNIAPCYSKVHSAVFPKELCKQVIKLYSFQNDLVFDPFAGSGTFAIAAIELNRNYLLTEKCTKYVDAIEERIGECTLFHYSFRRYDQNQIKQRTRLFQGIYFDEKTGQSKFRLIDSIV